ncbi:odorant-binding protein 2a-like [Chionomys nivalis]|uniref:odorant-binding protein 2a-like n=1 Tax=Chionomys nivalis TaxID=269649 RepID=UPI0025962036|nr:odorant-binding protein 2a-like [Chionomys nivalis]
MKSLLLTLLLGLVAFLKAQEVPSDDQEDYSGIWYPKAMIHNGSLPCFKIPSKVFPVKVTALEGGDLEADVIFWKNGQCHDVKILMKKTDEPGKFTSFDDKRFIYITELPVKDHYVIYCESRHPGKLFGVGKLIGRNPEPNPEAMEEFKKFVQHKGLKEENILVPELNETGFSTTEMGSPEPDRTVETRTVEMGSPEPDRTVETRTVEMGSPEPDRTVETRTVEMGSPEPDRTVETRTVEMGSPEPDRTVETRTVEMGSPEPDRTVETRTVEMGSPEPDRTVETHQPREQQQQRRQRRRQRQRQRQRQQQPATAETEQERP